jgi:hypothetical protein
VSEDSRGDERLRKSVLRRDNRSDNRLRPVLEGRKLKRGRRFVSLKEVGEGKGEKRLAQ